VERLTCETSEASHCVAAAQRFVKLAVIPEASNDYVAESTYLYLAQASVAKQQKEVLLLDVACSAFH
jgi:hypothetical protein